VYRHNSWLTYGIGLHRAREAGLGADIMDHLDKRPLSVNELYEWCMSMFVWDSELVSMRHPAKDWSGFISDLQGFLKEEKMVWNPIKKKLCPWIDVALLESIYHKRSAPEQVRISKKVSPDPIQVPQKSTSFHQGRQSPHARRHTESEVDPYPAKTQKPTSFYQGPGVVNKQPSHRRRVSIAEAEPPSINRKSPSFQDVPPKNFRRSTSAMDPPEDSSDGRQNYRKAQSFHHAQTEPKTAQKSKSFHDRQRDPETISLDSAPSKPKLTKRQTSSFHDPCKSSTIIKEELQASLFAFFDEKPQERSLGTVIKEWSHEPNGKLRPLEMLLLEAPVLLPPNNPLVKHHEYFDKWKILHRDSFKDGDRADANDDKIRKVARKCKIFLHPDKWPSDLNEDQKFLLQAMWDTLSESALF
jgi:hypothetical protein